MSQVSYSEAKQKLQTILHESVFHQTPPQESWWQRFWSWVARRLHLSLSFHALSPLGGIITVLVAAGILGSIAIWLIIRWRNRSWRLVERQLASGRGMTLWEQLAQALNQEDLAKALHVLVAIAIQYAQEQEWLQDRPYKTARRCLREMKAAADKEFAVFFAELVAEAEQALFANKSIDAQRIRQLAEELRQRTRKVSA